jgi:hypothetical protein
MSIDLEYLFARIRALPVERIEQIENFVDFITLLTRDRTLTGDATAASSFSFGKIWDQADDDAYDTL